MIAPVVFFAYNRPDHLLLTLNKALDSNQNPSRDFYIFIDGARNSSDAAKVEEVVRTATKFTNLKIVRRNKNFGTSKNIVSGITQILNIYKKIIVLEDDILIHESFFDFMDTNLARFEFNNKIGSVQGYSPDLNLSSVNHYFMYGADCWGWGTWKRAWDLFEPSGYKLLKSLQKSGRRKEFDLQNSYPFTSMLQGEALNYVDSWAIKWHASLFLRNKLSLYPNPTIVKNIGFDGSGVNSPIAFDRNSNSIEMSVKHYQIDSVNLTENIEIMRSISKYNSTIYSYFPITEFIYRLKNYLMLIMRNSKITTFMNLFSR